MIVTMEAGAALSICLVLAGPLLVICISPPPPPNSLKASVVSTLVSREEIEAGWGCAWPSVFYPSGPAGLF